MNEHQAWFEIVRAIEGNEGRSFMEDWAGLCAAAYFLYAASLISAAVYASMTRRIDLELAMAGRVGYLFPPHMWEPRLELVRRFAEEASRDAL